MNSMKVPRSSSPCVTRENFRQLPDQFVAVVVQVVERHFVVARHGDGLILCGNAANQIVGRFDVGVNGLILVLDLQGHLVVVILEDGRHAFAAPAQGGAFRFASGRGAQVLKRLEEVVDFRVESPVGGFVHQFFELAVTEGSIALQGIRRGHADKPLLHERLDGSFDRLDPHPQPVGHVHLVQALALISLGVDIGDIVTGDMQAHLACHEPLARNAECGLNRRHRPVSPFPRLTGHSDSSRRIRRSRAHAQTVPPGDTFRSRRASRDLQNFADQFESLMTKTGIAGVLFLNALDGGPHGLAQLPQAPGHRFVGTASLNFAQGQFARLQIPGTRQAQATQLARLFDRAQAQQERFLAPHQIEDRSGTRAIKASRSASDNTAN
jgi:hypothetical protein